VREGERERERERVHARKRGGERRTVTELISQVYARARTTHTPAPPKAPAVSSSFPLSPSLRPPSASSGQDSHLQQKADKPSLVFRA
jgi:hypothetical protein